MHINICPEAILWANIFPCFLKYYTGMSLGKNAGVSSWLL